VDQTTTSTSLPRGLKILIIGIIAVLAVMMLTSALNRPTDSNSGSTVSTSAIPTAAVGHAYSQQLLQEAAAMTQGMGTPNASGPMFTAQLRDEQLRLALQDPEFVRELNQYEQNQNRMLGKSTP
jgi:hypothetical protein